jgi:hypothetical protein
MWGTSTWSLDGVHPTAKLGPCNDRWMVAYPRGLLIPTPLWSTRSKRPQSLRYHRDDEICASLVWPERRLVG